MRIAVWHNLPSGGGKRALYYHVRGLVERGHDVACWRLDTADNSYLPLSALAPEHVVKLQFSANSVRRFFARATRSYYLSIRELQAFDIACRQCAREIDAGGFDLLFANSAASFYVPYVLRHVRIPKALYLQEPSRFMYEATPILPWVAGVEEDLDRVRLFSLLDLLFDYPRLRGLRVRARQEWRNVHQTDLVLVNSYFSRESVLRTYGIEAKVCYLGVDTSTFKDLGLPRDRIVVGLGSVDFIKGIDRAVRALALLPLPRPPLIWISNSGEARYENDVLQLAQKLGVDLQIKRSISDAELIHILNTATLLLYTSRLEPFGFAPLEGNACGLPVVAVREGGVRETVTNELNGILVDPEPQNIAAAVSRLLNDPGLARQLGANGLRHVEKTWSVDGSVDRLEMHLQHLVMKQDQLNNVGIG
ncbi:MAG TPA: glycosyltransferase family 4 protein [Pyrinomonadaceae bacterium]|nr:glycosyltransferase family 4 protein [Pyrinomonadaceae bacterium]